MTKVKDNQNERQPKWKTIKMKDEQNGRRPALETPKIEDHQNGIGSSVNRTPEQRSKDRLLSSTAKWDSSAAQQGRTHAYDFAPPTFVLKRNFGNPN